MCTGSAQHFDAMLKYLNLYRYCQVHALSASTMVSESTNELPIYLLPSSSPTAAAPLVRQLSFLPTLKVGKSRSPLSRLCLFTSKEIPSKAKECVDDCATRQSHDMCTDCVCLATAPTGSILQDDCRTK
jgi:hypothetical protein